MRIVVTGGTGYLGSYVMEALQGHDVLALDRVQPEGYPHPFVEGDVTDPQALEADFAGADAVIHLAAMANIYAADETRIMQVNVMGTWNVMLAAERAGVRRVVLCSSDSATGLTVRPDRLVAPNALPVREDDPGHPTDGYSLSKKLGEEIGRSFADRGTLEVVALRPVFVLYPRTEAEWRRRASAPDSYRPAADPHSPKAGGGPFWHYILPEDAATAFRLAAEKTLPAAFNCYFVVAPQTLHPEPTLKRAETVFKRAVPASDDRYGTSERASAFDGRRIERDLGFTPKTLDPQHFYQTDPTEG